MHELAPSGINELDCQYISKEVTMLLVGRYSPVFVSILDLLLLPQLYKK